MDKEILSNEAEIFLRKKCKKINKLSKIIKIKTIGMFYNEKIV
jgi:hypothetical protein